VQNKAGLLENAQGGTVLLDEIGEMPLAIQAKFLRVIEQRQVTRLGALRARTIDVRFIAATNRDLELEITRGRFRSDLYFRLNGASLVIPPLRERVSEIRRLADLFISQFSADSPERHLVLSPEAIVLLERYSWPGNVRELRNVIERAVLLATDDEILPQHLPIERMGRTLPTRTLTPGPAIFPPLQSLLGRSANLPTVPPPAVITESDERQRILQALEQCAGNQSRAATLLGISRGTLVNRLNELRIPRPRKPQDER
jgi:DNA-binding NtrC family response regulator